MNRQFKLQTVLLGASILLLFAYVGGVLIARERLADLQSELLLQASEQRALLSTIAQTTARNGADEVTERVIKDCSSDERATFEALLDRLDDGLSSSELTVLERLFGRCGSFYAERKSVMVARFEREVEVYEHYVTQLDHISDIAVEDYQVEDWRLLVEAEKRQSHEFGILVLSQDNIISALLEGKSSSSPEIVTILQEVKRAQGALAEANQAAAEKRTMLTAL